jgi:hypothetical protein
MLYPYEETQARGLSYTEGHGLEARATKRKMSSQRLDLR